MAYSSVLEYARYHGLAREHRSVGLIQELLNDYNLNHCNESTQEANPPLCTDFSAFHPPLEEPKLQLSRAGGAFLASCVRPPSVSIQWNKYLPDPHQTRKLKLEEPLLATDHNQDVAAFKREVRRGLDWRSALSDYEPWEATAMSNLDAEWDDIQAGKSLEALWKEVEMEKINTTKGALVNLSQVLRDQLTEEDMKGFYERQLPPIKVWSSPYPCFSKHFINFIHLKKQHMQPPTPLLIAEDPSISLFDLTSSDLDSEMPVEDINILDDLLEHVDDEIQRNDTMLSEPSNASHWRSDRNLGTVCATSEGDVEETLRLRCIDPFDAGQTLADSKSPADVLLSASPKQDQTTQSPNLPDQDLNSANYGVDVFKLKVPVIDLASTDDEGALGPFASSAGAPIEAQHGDTQVTAPFVNHDDDFRLSNIGNVIEPHPGDLVEVLAQQRHNLNTPFEKLPYKSGFHSEADLFAEEVDTDLINFVDAAAHQADEVSAKEKGPISKDSLTVKVPKLAPFQFTHCLRSQSRDQIIPNAFHELSLNVSWSMKGLEDEKKMNWVPFKSSKKINLEETISDDSERFLNLISPPKDVVRSAQLLFKEPGLRILDSSEGYEEELEENGDLANLISQQVEPKIPQKRPAIDQLLARLPVKRSPQCTKDIDETEFTTRRPKGPLDSAFSASNALETFLDLRGSKFKRMTLPPAPRSADEIENDPIQTQTQEDKVGKASRDQRQSSDSLVYPGSMIQVPATPVQDRIHKQQVFKVSNPAQLSWRRSIVVETSMLKTHRSLTASLEHRGGGNLDIIYREMNSGHKHLGPNSEPPDVILNPASCLILTNLQAISQKSLPGQNVTSSDNKVRRKVQALAKEYDLVFIVATVPRVLGGNFTQSHMDVISTFTGYCASFKWASVTPVWVVPENLPAKTDEAINAWTWSLISQHAFPTSKQPNPVTLIHDETSWEHFLRKAGMNPMASQVVLGMLHKDPSAQEDHADKPWGLSRLVRMSAEERDRRFERVIGKRAVERMNAVLDGEWN